MPLYAGLTLCQEKAGKREREREEIILFSHDPPPRPTNLHTHTHVNCKLMTLSQFPLNPVLTNGLEVASISSTLSPIVITGYHHASAPKAATSSSGGPGTGSRQRFDSSGLLAIDPKSGNEVWRRLLFARPWDHTCRLQMFDANGNGVSDCVVVGDRGLMEAVDPVKGKYEKRAHH